MLPASDPADVQDAVKQAAEALLAGGLVAYPTESFYGLGVDAGNKSAVGLLFRAKRRRPTLPVLILLSESADVEPYVTRIPDKARRVMEAFWPGGVTLVFQASAKILPQLTAGTGKIGIRVSGHPLARALVREAGVPVTGTSANLSGSPACRTAAEVVRQLGNRLDVVLDGGRTPGEAGSTILDVTMDPPVILRQGLVNRNRLEEIVPISKSRSHPDSG